MPYIRYIHDVPDLQARILHGFFEDIFKDIGPQVAYMGIIVHSRPAGVQSYPAFLYRYYLFLCSC
ncbi:hypothetical protein SDC9_131324 [bioreactor metagenome]|uniref:Uncharacterized protein n=1 Tax=bioreactor metagenome TaxID=1076179 RepID=A0A645D5K9_9ZZZZ